jgi:outer membrane protein assembly factor BamD
MAIMQELMTRPHTDAPHRAGLATRWSPLNTSVKVVMALVLLALLIGCAREVQDDDGDPELLYQEAREALDNRRYGNAIDLYRTLTTRFPFGRHAEQAQLDMAYAMYRANQPEAAVSTLDRFIRTYPTHPNVDYAWYLKGLVHYDQAMGFLRRLFPGQVVDRDQEMVRRAFQDLQELTRRYPQSRYVPDARQRMVFLRNAMADYEITVGEYYYRRGAYIGAVNRARYVLEYYPGAPTKVDALDLLARSYQAMGIDDLADDTRLVLELNRNDSPRAEQERRGLLQRLWPFD